MAITLFVGSTLEIASTYGASVNMTAITNAAQAVATLAVGHGVVVGDILEITSGWSSLTGRLARVLTVATNDVTLEGINTSNATTYPAGTGSGTIRRITAWTQLTQLTSGIQSSGGDLQYASVTTLQDRVEKNIPTRRTPVNMTVPAYFDPRLSWMTTVRAASDSATATGMRFVFPDASRVLGNAYWNLSDVPTFEDSTLRIQIGLTMAAAMTSYST